MLHRVMPNAINSLILECRDQSTILLQPVQSSIKQSQIGSVMLKEKFVCVGHRLILDRFVTLWIITF